MNGPSIQRSGSFQPPASAPLESRASTQEIGAPRRLSQAVPAPPARALSLHSNELLSILSDRIAGMPNKAANDEVSARFAIELDTEELNAALQESQPSLGAKPFSASDALSFRTMMSQAGQATASELIDRLWTEHATSPDPVVQQRLNQVMKDLQSFKSQVASHLERDTARAGQIQGRPAASAAAELADIKALMGGQIKAPYSLKNLWKFGLSDNRRAKAQLQGIERAAKQGGAFVPPGPPVHLQAAMTAHLKGVLKRAGLADQAQLKSVKGDLARQMATYNERTQSWQTINNTLTLQNKSGEPVRFENRITPARDFSAQVAATYAEGQKGVSCLSNTNATQTVNLWKTDFQAEGSGVTFSALRHGIHDAYKIKDAQQREQAASAKVEQFLRAAVDAYPDKLRPSGDGSYGSYVLDLVSVSLVSPGKLGDEGTMWAHQRDAYEKANGQSLIMHADLGDGQGVREITVEPRILAFSTPVNSSALESAVLRPLIGGLDVSRQANQASIAGLIGPISPGGPIQGLAGQKIADLNRQLDQARLAGQDTSALNAHLGRIEGLVRQVREIMSAPESSGQSWQRAGNEPYKLASRLTALANEVGAVAAFNCKSGKDRTGELDVQVKQLYARLHNEGAWPTPNEKEDPVDAQNHVALVREGGSFQIQKDNTSLPGSKVEVKALVKPLIKAMRDQLDPALSKQEKEQLVPKEAFKGLSAWVGS